MFALIPTEYIGNLVFLQNTRFKSIFLALFFIKYLSILLICHFYQPYLFHFFLVNVLVTCHVWDRNGTKILTSESGLTFWNQNRMEPELEGTRIRTGQLGP